MSDKNLNRRDFVKTTGGVGAGLVVGFQLLSIEGCGGPPPIPPAHEFSMAEGIQRL